MADQTEPLGQARLLYEQAVFNGDDGALPAADLILDATEAGLALARGRLRREIGFTPGVAAGVLALAELAARAGDRDRALALLDEATAIAAEAGAQGILRWADRARQELSNPPAPPSP